jgi:thiol-disulfide isomerase/thioredoxin
MQLSEFSQYFNGPKALVLKFGRGADSPTPCPACVELAPALQDMEEKFPDLTFLTIDVDDSPDLKSKYNIKKLPTTLIVYKRNEMGRICGNQPDDIQNMLEDFQEFL